MTLSNLAGTPGEIFLCRAMGMPMIQAKARLVIQFWVV